MSPPVDPTSTQLLLLLQFSKNIWLILVQHGQIQFLFFTQNHIQWPYCKNSFLKCCAYHCETTVYCSYTLSELTVWIDVSSWYQLQKPSFCNNLFVGDPKDLKICAYISFKILIVSAISEDNFNACIIFV